MSGEPALAVVGSGQSGAWRAALESAVRAEFQCSPLILPADSPLVPVCGVQGCCRLAELAAWGGVDTRLCSTHARRWKKAGRPPKDEWLPAQPRGSAFGTTERCQVVGCPRSAAGDERLCLAHRRDWRRAGTPALSAFASSATPTAAEDGVCRIAGCGFAAWTGRARTGLCDAHAVRYRRWRSFVRRQRGEPDPYIARISICDGGAGVNLALPAGPLLALELRFVLHHRHERGRLSAWGGYARYAWETVSETRMRCGLADPWEPDVWRVRALPIDQAAKIGHLSTLDWRVIEPAWLRQ